MNLFTYRSCSMFFLGALLFSTLSCGKEDSVRDKILAYFEGIPEFVNYLDQPDVDLNEPSIVLMAGLQLPDNRGLSLDVYWIGKGNGAVEVGLQRGQDKMEIYRIGAIESETVPDPIVETYTGHGIIVLPTDTLAADLKDGKRVWFTMIDTNHRPIGKRLELQKMENRESGKVTILGQWSKKE